MVVNDNLPYVGVMDYAAHFAAQAQQWHETDHGMKRGKPLRRSKFREPADDILPENVPASFRDCTLCQPATIGEPDRSNPFWFRVVAWESDN